MQSTLTMKMITLILCVCLMPSYLMAGKDKDEYDSRVYIPISKAPEKIIKKVMKKLPKLKISSVQKVEKRKKFYYLVKGNDGDKDIDILLRESASIVKLKRHPNSCTSSCGK